VSGRAPHIGLRLGADLLAQIRAIGPDSAAVKALLILGLHAAGADITPYRAEARAALLKIRHAGLHDALDRALFNRGSTGVQPGFNPSPVAPPPAPPEPPRTAFPRAETTLEALLSDPLAGVGLDV